MMPVEEEQKDPELSKSVMLTKKDSKGVSLSNMPPEDTQHSIEPLYFPKSHPVKPLETATYDMYCPASQSSS